MHLIYDYFCFIFRKRASLECKVRTIGRIILLPWLRLWSLQSVHFFNALVFVTDQHSEPCLHSWSFSQQPPYPNPQASSPLHSPSSGEPLQWPRCVSKQSGLRNGGDLQTAFSASPPPLLSMSSMYVPFSTTRWRDEAGVLSLTGFHPWQKRKWRNLFTLIRAH